MHNAESFQISPGGAQFFSYNGEDQHPSSFIPHPYAIQKQERISRHPNMSTNPARQPKARKRLNGLNRERTVTTLTDHLHGQFPTPSQQPTGSFFTPVPYTAESMSAMAMMNTQGYDMSEGYGYEFEMPVGPMYHSTMNHNHGQSMRNSQQQQQPQGFPKGTQRQQHGAQHRPLNQSRSSYDSVSNMKDKPALPDGKNDLEILQNLKKLILENQHPFYKAVPKPEYLAQLYKGQIPTDTPAKESISNGKTSVLDPDLKVEPSLVDIGGVGALEAEGQAPEGLGQGNATQQNTGTNVGPQAVSAPQIPLPEVALPNNSAGGTHPHPSENFAMPVLSSVHPDAPSASVLTTPNLPSGPPTKQPASPSSSDVKPAIQPPHDTEAAHDSMPVDIPPQLAAFEVSAVKRASPVPLIAQTTIDQELFPGENIIPVSTVPSQPQKPLSARLTQTTDFRKPAEVAAPTSLSVPVEETVPFDGIPPTSSRPTPYISAVAPPVAADIVPFGGTSSLIPGLGPMVSTSSFAPVLTSAQPSVQPKPVVDPRSPSAPTVTPSVSITRPPNVPALAGPPAPVNLPDAEQVTRPSLKERLGQPPVHQQLRSAGEPSSESLSHPQDRDANTNNLKGRNKKNQNMPYPGPPKGGDRSYNRPPGPSDGPPPAGAPLRAPFRGRSPPDNRKLPVSSPGSRGPPPRDFRGPPVGRSPSRERGGYSRPPPHDFVEARRHNLDMDGPPPGRYDARPSYDDYPSAPPLSGGRGPPPDVPPSGREDYYGSYTQGQDRNPRWEGPYYKRDWERGPPPVSADRGRFDRDYEPPGSWERLDRDFSDREPLYPEDDRYTPREPERARPPVPYTPIYSRVRGRSPSPIGRPGPGEAPRPPVKRAREDFGPEYYPGPGGGGARQPPVRRGPPGDYAPPPPRSGGGPGGADWNTAGGGPLPTSGSSMGGSVPGNRDYMGRGDASMEYSPLPDSYDRPRSPPPASGGRPSYSGSGGGGRGPYNRGPERYGGMRIPP